MRILAIGDVTSPGAAKYLSERLWSFREKKKIDFAVVNAENAGFITGATPELADMLLKGGADCLSGGNHTLRQRSVYTYLDDTNEMLRPINFGDGAPGRGYTVLDASGLRILVINAMGTVGIDPVLDSPYSFIDKVLLKEQGKYDISVLDFHAEATGEKLALGYAYDGKINVIFGTHTHVPTADAMIMPNGTGYVTDVGMCGETGGVLGMEKGIVIEKMRTRLPLKFSIAPGEPRADGVIFTVDNISKRVTAIERVII